MARCRQRQRGSIEELPSGALRVRVYAGVDVVTGREHYLRELIPNGPKKREEAEVARTRLLNEINERRHPRTVATVQQLLDLHLPLMHVAQTTRRNYERYVRKHVTPLIGQVKIADLDADLMDSYYAELLTLPRPTAPTGDTSAPRSPRGPSARSTLSCPEHTSGPSAGTGSVRTQ